jgi:hypothetical protein
MSEIITELPESFLREFEQEVMGTIPDEKVQADLRQAEIGRVLINEGAQQIEGVGQKLGTIDARIWHRWHQMHPGCWDDKQFRDEFFSDNPKCRAPGWTPKQSKLRHGITFIGGESVSNLKTP